MLLRSSSSFSFAIQLRHLLPRQARASYIRFFFVRDREARSWPHIALLWVTKRRRGELNSFVWSSYIARWSFAFLTPNCAYSRFNDDGSSVRVFGSWIFCVPLYLFVCLLLACLRVINTCELGIILCAVCLRVNMEKVFQGMEFRSKFKLLKTHFFCLVQKWNKESGTKYL